jgi:hypothetical protein
LNSVETHEANSKAISEWANVPPFFPKLLVIPIALVLSIHLEGDKVKALFPDPFNKESNSTPLKIGLFNLSQSPKNSNVDLDQSQFFTTSFVSCEFFFLAISVNEIYFSSF